MPNDKMFFTWGKDEASRTQAYEDFAKDMYDFDAKPRRSIGHREDFRNIDTNISVRTGFQRKDYDFFRPGEVVPTEHKEAICACMRAYEKVGLVRNVIDLMADFACQGIRLVHPSKQHERLFKQWWEKMQGRERSERFVNLLYRTGNVIVKRTTAKLKKKDVQRLRRAEAKPDITKIEPLPQPEMREIPWEYHFLNPLNIDVLGGELASMVGKPVYGLKISTKLRNTINNPTTKEDKEAVAKLPAALVRAAKEGLNFVPLDMEKVAVFHYKKDDWMQWAYPMTYAILDDIVQLEKTKLADIAALDGVITNVRLWTVGDLESKLIPTRAMLEKVNNVLLSNVGGGTIDMVWGPELKFTESSSNSWQFLGAEKYGPVLSAIYAGLGIPPTLTGSATESGFTNNYISLKTLIERLQYGRSVLLSFWNKEIRLFQKAMGIAQPAQVHFDRMTLSDEAAEKALLVQLWDRDIISVESLLERFDEIPELEKQRIIDEQKARKDGEMPDRIGPYDIHEKADLKKLFISAGIVTPSEVGLELAERKKGERPALEIQGEQGMQQAKMKAASIKKGKSGQGRPKGKGDSAKRKTKTVKPVGASLHLWLASAQKAVAELVNPGILATYGKTNIRRLTVAETEILEQTKFGILMNLEPFCKVTAESVYEVMQNKGIAISARAREVFDTLNDEFVLLLAHAPNTDEIRQMQILTYTILQGEESNVQD